MSGGFSAYLNRLERVALDIKKLYFSYGYDEYRLSGFEDYSLYAENNSFLDGKGVLSFSVGGRMLALRPDVTLSVVKNVDASACDEPKKLYYDERVYRKASGGGEFSELRQIGVEVIGRIDGATEAEVCELILKTLEVLRGGRYVVDVSHAGMIEKALNALGGADTKKRAAAYLESKNVHDFYRFADGLGIDKKYVDAFAALMTLPTDPKKATAVLDGLADILDISDEIAELAPVFAAGGDKINVNFSIGGDADYYNGVVFKGYVEGVPYAVLSGGRYDKLLGKFDKRAEAIGFALYLGELDSCFSDERPPCDAVVVYNERSICAALELADELRAKGLRVRLCRDIGDFDGAVYYAEDNG